jgi:hypothetical protein
MNDVSQILAWVQVAAAVAPVIGYLIKIDRKLDRMGILQDVQQKQLDRLERRVDALEGHPIAA